MSTRYTVSRGPPTRFARWHEIPAEVPGRDTIADVCSHETLGLFIEINELQDHVEFAARLRAIRQKMKDGRLVYFRVSY